MSLWWLHFALGNENEYNDCKNTKKKLKLTEKQGSSK